MINKSIQAITRTMSYAVIAARQSIIENAEFIENLNREQLSEGQKADGSFLPNYSQTSVSVFGKPPGPIKLFETGDFYEGINLNVFDDEFTLEGEDEKTGMLIARYGDMILGLTPENKQRVIDWVRPVIIEKMRRFYSQIA